ncbi:flagellar hook-length control protein FliK [Acidovorax sp. SRB_24]|uniref:flagellar hook-length control protein FliK n=1 Tax=Acidovorax sp. SRB_24 TaxID=1962700 RepID=UPI001F0E544C|nr:flagellar hook-length control protein FliK [Acidovorax sp. SRB_24]
MEQSRISAPPAHHTQPTARAKAALAPAVPDDAAAAGGFFSLLAALGEALSPEPVAQDATALAAGDPAAALAWAGTGPGLPLAGRFVTDPAAVGAELLPVGGLVAQTARLDAAAGAQGDEAAEGAGAALAGYRRIFSRMQSAVSSGTEGASRGVAAPGMATAAGDRKVATAMPLPGTAALPPERRDGAAAGADAMAAPPRGAHDPGAPPALWQALTADTAVPGRSAARGGEGAPGQGAPSSGPWGSDSPGPQGPAMGESAGVAAEAAQFSAEDGVAEQVAYWVGENLQNAELTVSHDGQPVEVSVSLSGNEAHVAFRSDQSETRELLDAGVAQLHDMLRSEGLVLSGVTVGSSGGRSAPDGEGRPSRGQPGGRQGQGLVAPAAAPARAAAGITDRSVDVFV